MTEMRQRARMQAPAASSAAKHHYCENRPNQIHMEIHVPLSIHYTLAWKTKTHGQSQTPATATVWFQIGGLCEKKVL